jgi:hypothetical protein
MKNKIISTITDYVVNDKEGKVDFAAKSGYGEPLCGFASVNDTIFTEYKILVDN